MDTLAPQLHVCFGFPSRHRQELEEAAAKAQSIWWNFHKKAVQDDHVVFYMTAPVTAFVAVGVIAEEPDYFDDEASEWQGRWGAEIGDVLMLQKPVSLADARRQFPQWCFLRQPRHSSLVPTQWAAGFLTYLTRTELPQPRLCSESDIEGTKVEVVSLKSQRSRRLRDLAFNAANGICCVCRRDFSKALDGQGIRVLQVHHREQLAARRAPAVTRVEDLAVVCANCHMLLHLNPTQALGVEKLRDMLQHDPSWVNG